MLTFLTAQLDFILFFYGLAFIFLGITAFAIARTAQADQPWRVLGIFGLLHGTCEWLDLAALVISDAPSFALFRIVLMAASFIVLAEFARQEATWLDRTVPTRWIYVPLALLIVLGGALGGPSAANALARYLLAFPGALATSFVFALRSRSLPAVECRLAVVAAVSFALYAVAAGIIVPAAPLWPANQLNQAVFAQLTGVPIQLVRGLLACVAAYSIWHIWGEKLVKDMSSTRYTKFLHKQFVRTLTIIPAIMICGWGLTEYLGKVYEQNLRDETRGELILLTSRLAGETTAVDGMAQALAGSPTVKSLLAPTLSSHDDEVRSVVNLAAQSAGAKLAYIVDATGALIFSSAPITPPFFPNMHDLEKTLSAPEQHFVFDPATSSVRYFASFPVHGPDGALTGAAVIQRTLASFEVELNALERTYFLIDPNGIITLTNRPESLLRMMWPLPAETRLKLAQSITGIHGTPMLPRQIETKTWAMIDGERVYVRQTFLTPSRWSLVMLTPVRGIFASRVLGIAITFLATIMALMYLMGRQRLVHDHVQMDKRLELEERARDLDFIATTDPLTGLCNRLKFNQTLSHEMLRSHRYGTPLSLILYDVDRFKEVNDLYGHQVGDNVLIELSRFIAARVRRTDLLARWGGEEFVILVPASDGPSAFDFAQSLVEALPSLKYDQIGSITCSFGIAQYVEGDTAESLLARADEALYRAKMNGRNRAELERPVSEPPLESVA